MISSRQPRTQARCTPAGRARVESNDDFRNLEHRTIVCAKNPPIEALRAATREVFARHPTVRVAMLFGSTARGTSSEQSYIDIAIAGRGVDLPGLASERSRVLGREIDLVAVEVDPSVPLLRELLRDGVCVRQEEVGAEAALRARALWIVETDGPAIDEMARSYVHHLASRARP